MSKKPPSGADELGLVPMRPLGLGQVKTTDDLLRQMSNTAFTGRALGEAVDVMEAMIKDDCLVVMTLTGAMTMAGLGGLIIEMIERGWVDCLVSTGALVGHGMVEDLGLEHFKARRDISDLDYYDRRLNRVYDTIEPEDNLDLLEVEVRRVFVELHQAGAREVGTCELLEALGEKLPGRGVLQAARRRAVPIFIPAFTDSELGLDFAVYQLAQRERGAGALVYDAFADLHRFAGICERKIEGGGKLGIFTIGGGVPRNWSQQVGPYVDVRNKRMGCHERPKVRFSYGVRVCPDPVHYGHLSGCTYSEGVSWGKFVAERDGGRYAEVLLDATVAWPLLVQALIERGVAR